MVWNHDRLAVIGWQDRALAADRVHSLASRLFARDLDPLELSFCIPGKKGETQVHGVTLPVTAAADAFLVHSWVPWRTLSASLAWGATMATLARSFVDAGLVVPNVDPVSGLGRWSPMIDEQSAQTMVSLTEAMPPVFGSLHPNAHAWQLSSRLIIEFVDDIARARLGDAEAGGPPSRDRRPVAVVTRRLLGALINEPNVVTNNPAEKEALSKIATELNRWAGALTARSPLADYTVFVRLQPFDEDELNSALKDPDGTAVDEGRWTADLCVAPISDPSLYVDAQYVWFNGSQSKSLIDAGLAQAALRFAAERLGFASPTLHDALDVSTPSRADLTIEQVVQIVHHDLDAITATGIVVQLPSWWTRPTKARTVGRATPTEAPLVGAGLTAKGIVAINWTIALGDLVLTDSELDALAAAKYDVVHVRGRWSVIDRAEVAKALTGAKRLRREIPVASALELLSLAGTTDAEITGTDWAAELLAGLPDDHLEPVTHPQGFVGTLRPYQQRGVGWLAFLARLGLGGLLADDMGLGKTAQLLALATHEGTGPSLIICPLSVVHNWETEAARFVPHLRVGVHHGGSRTDGRAFTSWAKEFDVIITTFATATRDVEALSATTWARMVIDEAQHLKNARTNAAKAIRRIPAAQRIALTGTPVENRLADLWAIMDLVNPGILGSSEKFRQNYARPIERDRNPDVTKQLQTIINPFLLRRLKSDRSLVPELPDKIEGTAWATLSREQASLYRAVTNALMERLPGLDGMNRRAAIITTITKLKQICNHPVHYLGDGSRLEGRSGKLSRLDELLDDAFAAEDQVIAFTQYVEMGLLVQQHLAARLGMDVPFLYGAVTKHRRDAIVARFQGGGVPLLLVSLKAGGSGLNLTAASQVIHIDRWWNPAVEDQASDRAWRIGQKETVFVHKLVTRGTIEERIDKLIAEKRELADHVLGGTDGWITELSTDDIRELLVLTSEATAR
jgi:SNF2-related domain/SNF2 Helicase protein/Helicase conserved C-terminal domain